MRRSIKKFVPVTPRKFIFCDVGARWDLEEPWKSFGDLIGTVGFEPDKEEYENLKKDKSAGNTIYPYALYREPKNVFLNLTQSRGCSSLYLPNHDFLKNYSNPERFVVEDVVSVKSTTLDILYRDKVFSNVDFIKIDVQGAELDVLKGGEKFFK